MHRLWLNADDFGLTQGVSEGILQALHQGAVHTTTAMMCSDDGPRLIATLAERARGRVGLHLQLSDGRPRSRVRPGSILVDEQHGRFPRKRPLFEQLDSQEVLDEWRAQLAALRALGIEPSHLDSHHDVHWRAGALEAYIQLALEQGLPARGGPAWVVERLRDAGVTCVVRCETLGDNRELSLDGIVRQVQELTAGCPQDTCVELGCHPGRVDALLQERSKYVAERQVELGLLCDPRLPERLQDIGVELPTSLDACIR